MEIEGRGLGRATDEWQPAAAEQFNFWLGRWTVSCLDDDGREVTGTNDIDWLYEPRALQERFRLPLPGRSDYLGTSISVPVSGRGWCQTWVDSEGNYLDFVGGWTGSSMILERVRREDDLTVTQRMVWRDIAADSLTWEWLSAESDRPWRLNWRLDYRRRNTPAHPKIEG